MEMHQVRYFLALASTLNFTRAAELCCVTQPALTRAIRTLEHELGGPLITREGRLSHLTELGQRVLPVLERTYKSALSARAIARACSADGTLRLALTGSIDLSRIVVPLGDVISRFPNVEINILRGSPEEITEHLKYGDADLAISDDDLGSWERLDSWVVDRMPYSLVVNRLHPFATHQPVQVSALAAERLICLPYCSLARELTDPAQHEERKVCQVPTLGDIFALLQLNVGVALLPQAFDLPEGLVRVELRGFPLEHSTHLFAVAGRQRSKCAAAFVNHFAVQRIEEGLLEEQPSALPAARLAVAA